MNDFDFELLSLCNHVMFRKVCKMLIFVTVWSCDRVPNYDHY